MLSDWVLHTRSEQPALTLDSFHTAMMTFAACVCCKMADPPPPPLLGSYKGPRHPAADVEHLVGFAQIEVMPLLWWDGKHGP